MERLARDWPVYVMGGAMIGFFVYVVIKSNLEQKKEQREAKNKEKGGK